MPAKAGGWELVCFLLRLMHSIFYLFDVPYIQQTVYKIYKGGYIYG